MSIQFVVQLHHRPGALAALTGALAARGVDIRAITGGGAGERAYATITTDDDVATRDVLRSGGYPFVEGETLVIAVEDRPGGLAAVTGKLAAAGVDIRSILFVETGDGVVQTALAVDDVARARAALGLD